MGNPMSQQFLPIGRHGIPLEIEQIQPDPARVADRLAEAHELAESFRRDKAEHLAAIKRMLKQDARLQTADKLPPNQGVLDWWSTRHTKRKSRLCTQIP